MSGETTYRMIFRGLAYERKRSGETRINWFYVWAVDADRAIKDAERVFPRATRIVVRKRGG